ncbi:MAG: 1-acyl-sn-glycerol-3-phosphate acyltransferase [Pseudomonadota bacterium]
MDAPDGQQEIAQQDFLNTGGVGPLGRGDKHIVDVLIEERAENLVASPRWPIYRAILYPILKQKPAIRLTEAVKSMTGFESMQHLSDLLSLDVQVTRQTRVPPSGRVLIAPNHPTGIADGVAMFDALLPKRADMKFFANRDAIRMAPQLIEVLIPVEWVEEKRTRQRSRETLIETKRAFSDEACVILFPSGRLAYMDENKVLTEQEWMSSIAIFARKYNCPVLPVNIKARNSWLYYWFWKLNDELRDITLFHELLNKRGKRFDITFGQLIQPEQLKGDAAEVARALRRHTVEDVIDDRPWVPVE